MGILDKLSSQYDIEILFATEGGSRLYGTEREDSDYDIRFVYRHLDLDKYLSIYKIKEDIQFKEGNYDCNGWDISKACRLLAKSTPSLYEWLAIPAFYLNKYGFQQEFLNFFKNTGSLRSLAFHYLNFAKGAKDFKHYDRALRAIAYILKHSDFPPVKQFEITYCDIVKLEEQVRQMPKTHLPDPKQVDTLYRRFINVLW